MSDGKNLYVLKQPVTSEQYDRWSYVMSEQVFNEAFTPLDVEAKRKQIAETIRIAMDVGAELLVLWGAQQTLRKHKPLVWCSIHPDMMERDYQHTKADLLFFMDECGYEAELLAIDHEEHWFFTPKGRP